MSEAIRVNFDVPMPLFSLPEPILFPHAVRPLHIFEPRYRQMVDESLDSESQIAIASFAGESWKTQYHGQPPLRPAVCVGHIVEHEGLPDGRHNILLRGICRAKIVRVLEPEDERLYRMGMLVPLEPLDVAPPPMIEQRQELRRLLAGPRLSRMRSLARLMEAFEREDVTTDVLLELIGFSLVMDGELKYRLLAEADPSQRAVLIKDQLLDLDHLLRRAQQQSYEAWPRGLSWN